MSEPTLPTLAIQVTQNASSVDALRERFDRFLDHDWTAHVKRGDDLEARLRQVEGWATTMEAATEAMRKAGDNATAISSLVSTVEAQEEQLASLSAMLQKLAAAVLASGALGGASGELLRIMLGS